MSNQVERTCGKVVGHVGGVRAGRLGVPIFAQISQEEQWGSETDHETQVFSTGN